MLKLRVFSPCMAMFVLTACGGPGPIRAPETAAAPAGVPDLTAQLQAAVHGPQPTDAVVTYAVFTPQPPAPHQDTKLAQVVDAAFRTPPAGLDTAARRAGPLASQLSVTAAPIDADLPLDLAVLEEQAGPLAGALAGAKGVVFVRYAGKPLPDHGQISGAGVAAVAVAQALGGVAVVDLSTFEARAPDAFAASLDAVPTLKSHVRIVPEARSETELVLRSRGMARFGRPDLEMAGFAPPVLGAAGAAYMPVLTALFEGPHAAVGATVAGVALVACQSPPEAVDHECVGMAPPK